MESFFQDVRYALRLLRNSPGFTAVAVITLALGIGANTAIFSVVNTVLLRPLPYQQPERLAMIWQSYPVSGFDRLGASAPEYIDYRDRSHSFSNVAAYAGLSFNLTADQQKPDRIRAARVTGNMFPLLGVAPYLGRTVSPEDDRAGGPKVAVLSYALWQQHFNSDREILGRSVRLDENPYTVIGVMPPSFKFPFDGTPLSDRADIWVPMAFSKYEVESRAVSYDFRVLARLKDGVSLEQARAEIQGIAAAMVADNPAVYPSKMRLDAKVSSFGGDIVANIKPALLVLLGAVGFVLLIACANIANLLLARASRRAREIAVRTAIGASPGRLVRQALTESLTLAVIGGGLGLLLANSAISLIARFGPADLPRVRDVRIEPVVLLFTLGASLLTGLIFGLAPALRSARVNLNQALKESGQATGEGSDKHRSRNLLVMVETASAVLLLFGAGLLLNSFVRVLHVSPGFEPGGLLMARTAFDRNRYPDPVKRRDVQRELLRRFQALPGVETVGLSVTLPLRDDRGIGFRIEGHDPTEFHHAKNDLVNNEYFRAMAIPVIQGRTFTDQDQGDKQAVVLINQSMAKEFWPNGDAVGKRILWGNSPFEVIGIVGDVKLSGLDAEVGPTIYMSTFQVESGISFQAVFALRTKGDPNSLAAAVQREIWSVDKELPVYQVGQMSEVVAESVAQRRFTTLLLASFAGIALLMAAVGLYGVISYSVAQRTRELGLRIALGASPQDVMRMILGEGSRLILVGGAVGLVAAAVLSRFMTSLLFGVRSLDPLTFVAVAVLLGLVALMASYIPARRATKVDPMIALRNE